MVGREAKTPKEQISAFLSRVGLRRITAEDVSNFVRAIEAEGWSIKKVRYHLVVDDKRWMEDEFPKDGTWELKRVHLKRPSPSDPAVLDVNLQPAE